MRLKLTLRRASGSSTDVVVTVDATVSVGAVAAALLEADPLRTDREHAGSGGGGPVTLDVLGASGLDRPRSIHPDLAIVEAGIRSGGTVQISRAAAADGADRDRGPAVAVLRVLSGPDAGREFPLPAGTSRLGRERGVDVRLSDPLISKRHARVSIGETVEIIDTNSANGLSMGGRLVQRAMLTPADVVVIGDSAMSVVPLARLGGAPPTTSVIDFTRSPRVVVRFEERVLPAPTPPSRPTPQRFPLLALVAPLIMGAVLYVLTQQLLSVIFVALSPLLAIGTWIDHTVTARRTRKAQVAAFSRSLEALEEDVRAAQAVERAVRLAEQPSAADAVTAIAQRGEDLWTHRPEHRGFLAVRLGVGSLPSRCRIEQTAGNDTEPEFLRELAATVERHRLVHGVPVVAELRSSGALGIAGPAAVRADVARAIAVQLVGTHSPAELAVAALTSPASRPTWSWLEWLPHTGSVHSPLAGEHLADNPGSGASLLSRLEELVEERREEGPALRGSVGPEEADRLPDPVTPAVIVVVEDDAPVDRARLIRLAERGPDAGVHVLWCSASIAELPAAARSFLLVADPGSPATTGQVRLGEHSHPVVFETVDASTALALARSLSPVVDGGVPVEDSSDLPREVAYAALAGPELIAASGAVIDRWRESKSITVRDGSAPVRRRSAGSLRALVGSAGTEPFYLDLRSQGPHALVGGTTGAGKSEFLQSWVLGLASAYSPDRVALLFVDYKGGAAFADCVQLPHTVGLVTDLSPHLVRRALTSLRAELRYREHLLNRKKAKDLVSLEKTGDPETPPSLLIIVDEFAALVNEVPEFVDGVVDVAQRGRSLGLHLILATQRPAGVIKDNLRANTNLRIALRMADADDSTDILGTPMAASFDPGIPGRGAAKTGPGRIAGFQTGYAGGRTTGEAPPPRIDIEEMAFGSGTAWEQSAVEAEETGDPGPTDIARMVATIGRAAADARVPAPRKPWLDELAPAYDFSKLPHPRTDDRLLLGVVDSPETQSQPTVFYEPDRDGNMAVFGTGGSGKSTTLRSIAVAAAVTPRGGPVQVYGLDFGANGLQMLNDLPHVGAIVRGDDDERVVRLLRMLRDLVAGRAERFGAVDASTIGEYRRLADRPDEPRILLLVDGIGAFREAYEYAGTSAWFSVFTQIATDGRQLGIHIVVAGDRPNSVPTSLNSTIQRRVVLRLAAEDDYLLLGVPKDVLSATSPPGRGVSEGSEVQIAVLGGESNVAIQARKIASLADAMRRQGAVAASPVERLPEVVPLAGLPAVASSGVCIGLADEDLAPIGVDASGAFLVAGSPGGGRTTALASLAAALRRGGRGARVVHLASRRSGLGARPAWSASVVGVPEVAAAADSLTSEIELGRFGPAGSALVIEGLTDFTGTEAEMALDRLVRAGVRAGVFVVGEGESSTWSQSYTLAQPFKAGRRGLLVVPGETDGDTLLGTPLGRIRRADLPPGRGFLIGRGRSVKLQIATDSG
ncbi:cell division protein FtsK [Rathayibacter sp. AY1G9]|uniref:FtsK/SpoIIIE domain-containing protein n=1 Tax=Rathayibacter sp. AY1G9 TaxID=2080565 RepID=UPI000CE72A95|nr:FtsK/SpoIIIE domain-containing protein [Rathayibacter sp. AY1G9]PPH00084.1 cell division protein FtsK [Rathayibacter sp. AY1G9]